MKTHYLLFSLWFFFISFGKVSSQDYVPMAVDGAHWIVGYDEMATPQPYDALWEYHTLGDTIVGEHTYLKVYWRELEINNDFAPPFNSATPYELVGLLREDFKERKVYAIQLSTPPLSYFHGCPIGEESLLFDFSLTVGDTASFCVLPDVFGALEISYLIDVILWGLETREFLLSDGSVYYEGIGSNYGLFEEMFAPFKKQNDRYVVSTFLEYYCRDTPCDYLVSTEASPHNTSVVIHPNPAASEFMLQLPEYIRVSQSRIELYGPAGRLLITSQPTSHLQNFNVSHLPKGLYLLRLWDGERWLVTKIVVN